MNEQKPVKRRRRWKRFTVRTGSIVLLHHPSFWKFGLTKTIELGPILNISQTGLMVQYMDSNDRRRKCEELSISVSPVGIQVEKLRYETILDFEVALLPEGKTIRNRSVRFINVTSYQTFQLETFIKRFAFGSIPDRRSGRDRRAKSDSLSDDFEWDMDRRSGFDRRKS